MTATSSLPGSAERFDVAIVGAGAVGLVAALAFARAGLRTCLVGPHSPARDGRTAALLQGSLALIDTLGLGRELEAISAPLRTLRIVDDTTSLFRPPPVAFRAAEIGLELFGRNVENAALVDLLAEAVHRQSGLTWRQNIAGEATASERGVSLALPDGWASEASLLVAADGRSSPQRAAAGIAVRERRYPQAALTTLLAHSREHGGASTEFHTRGGPFTLVPLPSRRSSLVWVMPPDEAEHLLALSDEAFARKVEAASKRLLGTVRVDGPRGKVPLGLLTATRMVGHRLVLVGEAAHALPPIGAQGLNLGLADVGDLVRLVRDARSEGRDIGSSAVLATYERRRLAEVQRRSWVVDGLNRSLLSRFLPLDAARGFGLGTIARIGPLRRAVMRAGLMATTDERPSGI